MRYHLHSWKRPTAVRAIICAGLPLLWGGTLTPLIFDWNEAMRYPTVVQDFSHRTTLCFPYGLIATTGLRPDSADGLKVRSSALAGGIGIRVGRGWGVGNVGRCAGRMGGFIFG
jgi:hypothetical protein